MSLLSPLSHAQQPGSEPRPLTALLKDWNATLEAADRSLGKPDLTDQRLEDLRAEVGRLRLDAIAAGNAARPEAQSVRDELQALGPPPAEGQPAESPAIATKRKAIGERLATTEGAVKEIELAIARADRILELSGALRRSRFTERLLAKGPSPWTAAVWQKAIPEFAIAAVGAWATLVAWVGSADFAQQAPRLLIALVAVLIPAWLLRRWVLSRYGYVAPEGKPSHGQRLRTAVMTGLARSFVPTAITLALYLVLRDSALVTEESAQVVRTALLALVFLVFVAAFSRAAFAPFASDWRIVSLSDNAAPAVTRIVTLLALVFALDWVGDELSAQFRASLEQILVHKFVSGLIIVLLLLALLRERVWRVGEAERVGSGLKQRVWARLRWLLRLLVLSIPISALLGYVALSRVLATQLVLTPGIFLASALLRRVAAEAVSHALSRQSSLGMQLRQSLSLTDEGSEMLAFWVSEALALVIFLGAGLALLVLWGAGRDDLATWVYNAFIGFKIGSVTLSLADILLAVLSFTALLTVTRLFQRMLEYRLFPRTRLDLGVRNSIRSAVGYVGFLLAVAIGVSVVGVDLNNLAIIAGALSVGIGFGLQNIVNNFVSGLILLVERPIKAGDWVMVGEHQGYVRKISVRATEITTFDRASVFIPNSNLIATPVTNRTYADKVGRVLLPVGVAYGTDTLKVREVLLSLAKNHPDVLKHPEPQVQFRGFGESAINLEVVAFIHDVDKVKSVTSDLGFEIDATFRREGLQIPFPQRDLHVELREEQLERLAQATGR